MSDTLRDIIATVIDCHTYNEWHITDDAQCSCGNSGDSYPTHVADEVMAVIEPAIATQATDTRTLAIGSCIALIEHTTALAQQAESPHNAAVIAEWSNKITTAMRMASAHITGGSQ